jgi:hypothetical protein
MFVLRHIKARYQVIRRAPLGGLQERMGPKRGMPPGAVSISAERQQLFGVRLERVEKVAKNSGPHILRTTGRVLAAESRVHKLRSGTDGWVQSLFGCFRLRLPNAATQLNRPRRCCSLVRKQAFREDFVAVRY